MRWFLSFCVLICCAIADIELKRAQSIAEWQFAVGALLYAASAIGCFYLFKTASMAWIAVSYSMASIILLTLTGILFFKEPITIKSIFGIIAAIIAIVLME